MTMEHVVTCKEDILGLYEYLRTVSEAHWLCMLMASLGKSSVRNNAIL